MFSFCLLFLFIKEKVSYSTVTDFARLRGLSTSQPNKTEVWYAISWAAVDMGKAIKVSDMLGIAIKSSYKPIGIFSISHSLQRMITFAPLERTSFMLLMVFSRSSLLLIRAKTGTPSEIREIVPCLSSPAA